MINEMVEHYGREGQGVTLQVTHRIARLPGFSAHLAGPEENSLVSLSPGAGALGALALWENPPPPGGGGNISFTGSRPWLSRKGIGTRYLKVGGAPMSGHSSPTHVLCGERAYPISGEPLHLYTGEAKEGASAETRYDPGVASHCSIHRKGETVILENHSPLGTYVDRDLVSDTALLTTGQILRLGDCREEVRLIACLEPHET